jgi:molecular chaperone DnaJ
MATTTTQRDYYEILGVPRDADEKTIKDAFRRLALKYHPDRSTEPDAEERFKQIAEAYAVLSDPRKRAEYDAHGFPGVAGFTPEDLWSGIDFGDLFEDLGFPGFDAGGGLFERLFGRRRRRGPPRGADIEVPLPVSLGRVATGGQETVTIHRPGPCPSCTGSGAKSGTSPRSCPACGGSGQRVTTRGRGGVLVQQITACVSCRGTGVIIDEPCPSCRGRGQVERSDTVTVQIPPGIEEGTALRIPGYGTPSPARGGVSGDAYVVVHTIPDPRFVRRGADLWHGVELTVPEAVLGASRVVPTLDADVKLEIPPGTQPDSVLRVPGKGLPRFDRTGRGNLYVSVTVRIPDHVDDRERHLYEQLRETGSAAARQRWGRSRLRGRE